MKLFVTGLCLQGNKGGPALAISLMHQLKKYLGEIQFIFSVPGDDPYFQLEEKWAQVYGVEVVRSISKKDIIPPWSWRQSKDKKRRWLTTLSQAQLLLELSGISYVGPPARSARQSLDDFIYFWVAKRACKPFLRWTMSYGPFSSWPVRALARLDLSSQPTILCRGEQTRAEVSRLLPAKKTLSFPDVAVVLPFSREWGANFLSQQCGARDKSLVVTVSPSAVIYATDIKQGQNSHVADLAQFSDHLLEQGYSVIFVPHTLRLITRDPRICDLGVCQEVLRAMKSGGQAVLVADDLSPMELKSIISNAFVHVGGRYHSIVAALSSGVPCISLAWHHKYQDLMAMYGLGDYIYYSKPGAGIMKLIQMFEQLSENNEEKRELLRLVHPQMEELVEENTRIFVKMLQQVRL